VVDTSNKERKHNHEEQEEEVPDKVEGQAEKPYSTKIGKKNYKITVKVFEVFKSKLEKYRLYSVSLKQTLKLSVRFIYKSLASKS
jgi:hypothetical protein